MDKALSVLRRIGEKRYRESHGLYYEDFDVGDVYEHRPGRTITEADNIWMSLLCMNTHPLHIDAVYASETEFGRIVVSSLVTFAIVGGLSLAGTSARGIANLGWSNISFTVPVYAGETIYAETRIVAKRESRSRPGEGIVTIETKGIKSTGEVFMCCERSFLAPLCAASDVIGE